jgi:hypothetical protein
MCDGHDVVDEVIEHVANDHPADDRSEPASWRVKAPPRLGEQPVPPLATAPSLKKRTL